MSPPGSGAHKWLTLCVMVMGTFMTYLDATVMNITIPKLMAVFSADVHQAQWVLTSYLLALATVIPATGYLADRFGNKRMYIVTLTLFTVGSFFCGASWSIGSLIAFRILQGLGGGMIQPLGMAILYRTFDPTERGRAMGWYGIATMAGPALGPTFGGYLVEYVSWRLIFYINLPVGMAAILAATALLQETPRKEGLKLDLLGLVLASAGSSLTLLGFVNGPVDGWTDTYVTLELAAGLALLGIFVIVELTTDQPLLELRLFKNVYFTNAMFVGMMLALSLFGSTFLVPLFLENERGLGPLEAGLILLPQSLAMAFTLPLSGRLFDRLGPRPVILPGMFLLLAATYSLVGLSLETTNRAITAALIVRGIGMGLVWMPATTAAMNSVPLNLIPRATSLADAMQRISSSFGTALMVSVLQLRHEYHYARLAQNVTASSLPVRQLLDQVKLAALQHGLGTAQATKTAMATLAAQVHQQATILSFDDAFFLVTVLGLPGLLAAAFIRDVRRSRQAAPESATEAPRLAGLEARPATLAGNRRVVEAAPPAQ